MAVHGDDDGDGGDGGDDGDDVADNGDDDAQVWSLWYLWYILSGSEDQCLLAVHHISQLCGQPRVEELSMMIKNPMEW